MKKYLLRTMLFGGLALTTACSDEVYNEPVVEDYSKDFIKEIGLIDPNQDWNMAEQKSVTVDPGTATEVKIYAENGIVHSLVADYKNLSGKQVLTFDAAKGVNSFVVVANGQAQRVGNGATVDFNRVSTRSYNPDVDKVFMQNTEYETFPAKEVHLYTQALPEQEINLNNGAIHNDFMIVSEDNVEITVYPIFWYAQNRHIFGIYTKDNEGNLTKTPIYANKVGTKRNGSDFTNSNSDVQYRKKGSQDWLNVNKWGVPDVEGKNEYANVVEEYRSKGFKVQVPGGQTYGFYIEVYSEDTNITEKDGKIVIPQNAELLNTFYTEKNLNSDADMDNEGVHAAFFHVKNGEQTRTFLSFEDVAYEGENHEFDMNDFLVILDPAPLVIDQHTEDWILAAEDLGNTDDYDFNDVVVKIKHVTGETTATITALAAGATYPIYLRYTNNGVTKILGNKEFHQWFGNYPADENGRYPMINTTSAGKEGETITIDVPMNYTISSFYDDISKMGGFTIKVGDASTAGVEETELTPPMDGIAPQMMVVSSDYKWPKERVSISEAYPDFGKWGAKWTYSNWINNPVEGTVLTNQN